MGGTLSRRHRKRALRNVEIAGLLDTLLVSSICTILLIRLQLWATHYPKLGGGKLHIAHLLWGGLAMLIAIVILLSFLGRHMHHIAAIIGGVGFGFFIDELGKFITTKNDYFFKPAAGIIYLVFILLFLATRRLERGGVLTQEECLANAAEMIADAARGELTENQRLLAISLLDRCDADHELTDPLKSTLLKVQCAHERDTRRRRFVHRVTSEYFRLVELPAFSTVVSVAFIIVAAVSLAQSAIAVSRIVSDHQSLEVISAAGTASSLVVVALIARGLYELRASRLAAYITFEHALLVQIFVGEVFAFLETQFGAAIGLVVNLALIITIRYMIRAERHLALRPDEPEIAGVDELEAAPGQLGLAG